MNSQAEIRWLIFGARLDFASDTLFHSNMSFSVPLYKNTHLDIDVNNKSDRIEWGHARYQATFRPDQAYEMCIQWAVASGNIVAELVSIFSEFKIDHQLFRLEVSDIATDIDSANGVTSETKITDFCFVSFTDFRLGTQSTEL